MTSLRLALSQFGAGLGDVEGNLAHMLAALDAAATERAEIVCFPELSVSGYLVAAEGYEGRLLDEVEQAERQLAVAGRRLGLTIVYGAPRRNADGGLHNAIVLQLPDGRRLVYAKSHMPVTERRAFDLGQEFFVESGGLGLACCYDLAFPEVTRILALGGARALIAPMAWEVQRSFVVRPLVTARAIENIAYVVAINQCGTVGQFRFRGQSCVIDPLGRPAVELGDEPGLAVVDLNFDLVQGLRDGSDPRSYPLLTDRRPELYGPILARDRPATASVELSQKLSQTSVGCAPKPRAESAFIAACSTANRAISHEERPGRVLTGWPVSHHHDGGS